MSAAWRFGPALFAPLALCLACASSDGSGAPPDGAGAAGAAGTGGGEPWPPPPSAFLAPEQYDCRASGPFEPPERPHPADCFADPGCSARLVAGHRMARPFAPENSLSALRAAILLGVDIAETDVRLTADGQVVLIHDGEVDRTLQGSGAVSDMTLAELRALPMKTGGYDPAADFSCDRVPTLDELFALSRGRIVAELEIKDLPAGLAAAAYLREHDLYAHAYMLCSPDECAAVRAAVPDVPIMPRAKQPDEVAALCEYDPPPVMVHIDPTEDFLAPQVLATIHAAGAKAYGNAFTRADFEAITTGRIEAYPEMYEAGLDVVQTEYPHWALLGLGRLAAPP
ncbi:MAG: glycerophosphodiester phosphodiesterase family protein [Deltaproteobacteria bacterium]|nr:glycerophosphodiester phosphodiesterase family protein [Deltaproteobacteria bacterium]